MDKSFGPELLDGVVAWTNEGGFYSTRRVAVFNRQVLLALPRGYLQVRSDGSTSYPRIRVTKLYVGTDLSKKAFSRDNFGNMTYDLVRPDKYRCDIEIHVDATILDTQ
jgi:hypothetical protein